MCINEAKDGEQNKQSGLSPHPAEEEMLPFGNWVGFAAILRGPDNTRLWGVCKMHEQKGAPVYVCLCVCQGAKMNQRDYKFHVDFMPHCIGCRWFLGKFFFIFAFFGYSYSTVSSGQSIQIDRNNNTHWLTWCYGSDETFFRMQRLTRKRRAELKLCRWTTVRRFRVLCIK